MKTLCVANHKGGVGKTTTSINLAAGLAMEGYKTLLIDCDPQGHSSAGLGIKTDDILTLADLLIQDGVTPADVIHPTAVENLSIIPCDLSLSNADLHLSMRGGKDYQLRTRLEGLKGFDIAILDCPPNFGTLAINAYTTASKIIIPIQLGFFSLKGVSSFLDSIKHVKERVLPVVKHKIEIFGVLITFYDSRTKISKEIFEAIKELFPNELFTTMIPQNIKLNEAQASGQSIFQYDSNCKGAEAYIELTREIIKRGI
jgi:chromosome partitioning protein